MSAAGEARKHGARRAAFFAWWGAVCHDRAAYVALAAFVVTAFCGYYAATIKIDLGFLALMDARDPLVKRVDDANHNFGGLDYLTIGLKVPDGEPNDKDRLVRFAKKLVPRLRAREDLVGRVVARVNLDSMLRWAPLFLDQPDLDEFARQMTARRADLARVFGDTHLVPFLTETNRLLEEMIIEENEIADDADAKAQVEALGDFYETAWGYFEGTHTDERAAKHALRKLMLPAGSELPAHDYYFSTDERLLIVRVMSAKPADDYIYTDRVMAAIDQDIAAVSAEVPGVRVLLAGNMPIMRDEHAALVHDMSWTTVASMVLVLIIFVVVFRKVSDLVLIAVCLGAGLAVTFGMTALAIGYLSLLTAFFGAVMIGLGIDFAIHLISRYGENIRNAMPVRDALIAAMVGVGPGVLTGAATTAAAFLVLMVARFKGLAQLGFVSGAGILVMLALMLSLLPALIALRDRRRVPAELRIKSIGDSVPLGRLADVAVRHPVAGGLVTAVLVIAAIVGAAETSFNWDYRSLEPKGAESLQAIHEVERHVGKSLDYALLIADSVEQSRQFAAAAEKQDTVDSAESIADFIPENQPAKNAVLRTLAPVFEPIAVTRAPGADEAFAAADFAKLAEATRGSARVVRQVLQLAVLGGKFELEDVSRATAEKIEKLADRFGGLGETATVGATPYQRYVAAELAQLLASLKLATRGETLTIDKLPEVIRENFVGKDGRLAVYVYPTENIWHKTFMKKHDAQLYEVDKGAVSVGILFEEVFDNILEDFRSSVWYSLAAVFLLVLVDFRRLRTALLAMIPLVVGSLWMVGLMPVLGMQFNVVNVAIVPLILGIGIDNGVHILHRFRMETENRVHNAVEHTGKAIMLSSLTTMAGFGTLGFATYVAIGSLGQTLTIGVATCFFTSVFVLPLILARIAEKGWRV